MAADDSNFPERRSVGGDIVRLGLKVGFAKRGEYLVEFLDDRKRARHERRLGQLGESAEAAGLDPENLIDRVENNDLAQELLEDIFAVAQESRSEIKLKYLGRCLAAALAGDDAAIDIGFMKVAAVRDLEAPHIRLLALLEQAAKMSLHVDESTTDNWDALISHIAVHRRRLTRAGKDEEGFDKTVFDSVMATLVRTGLVAESPVVDVDVDTTVTENRGVHIDYDAESDVTVDADTTYRVTLLGLDLLSEARAVTASDTDRR